MDCHQAYYLALLQGLTEFLPVSADSHRVLLPVLFHWSGPSPAFAVATRLGTLAAALVYFSGTLRDMVAAVWRSMSGKDGGPDARLAWYLILGSVPVGLAGLDAVDGAAAALRQPLAIATATLVFALALGLAQKLAPERRGAAELDWKDALVVGLCQAIALVPGASRTGLALTGGLLRGLERQTAARFSFLLSIPASAATALTEAHALIPSPEPLAWWSLLLGALLSGIVAYVAIDWFLKLLDRIGLMPFVIYRIVLGAFLFYVFL